VNWNDVTRLESQVQDAGRLVMKHGYLETHVTAIDFGRYGWQVHASIVNDSPMALRLLTPQSAPGFPVTYPNQGMSLIVQTDNGGGIKELQPLGAKQFTPELPQILDPNAMWTGTFSGSDPVKPGTDFYVGFGQFAYVGTVDSVRAISTSTAKSAQAPEVRRERRLGARGRSAPPSLPPRQPSRSA
jgi:hypothetical protein